MSTVYAALMLGGGHTIRGGGLQGPSTTGTETMEQLNKRHLGVKGSLVCKPVSLWEVLAEGQMLNRLH